MHCHSTFIVKKVRTVLPQQLRFPLNSHLPDSETEACFFFLATDENHKEERPGLSVLCYSEESISFFLSEERHLQVSFAWNF